MKLEQIHSHPKNPRKQLIVDELVESIKESGLLSPLLVRRVGSEFEIISGHRRKEALSAMGETHADCDIVEMTDEQAYKALMTANIQAHSLSEVEEAEGIKHMVDAYEWSQERVAKEFGKSQKWISFRLSLLDTDDSVKDGLSTRVLTGTHAREIAQLPQEKQSEVVAKVVEEKLSTRETAELVKMINNRQNDDSSMTYVEHTSFSDSNQLTIEGVENNLQIDNQINNREIHDSSMMWVETTPSTERKIAPSEQTHHQIDDKLNHREIHDTSPTSYEEDIKPEERNLYADPVMREISKMNGFVLRLQEIEIDLNPHSSIMDMLVDFNRDTQALHELDKIEFRIGWIRKHISNARAKLQGGTNEGTLLEFKRREA